MELNKYKLILGSQSPRRKELLSWIGLPFEIITANLDEISHETEITNIATDLASQKAHAVKAHVKANHAFIMASDTIVALEGKLYGKPKDVSEARSILLALSGRTHEVITGVSFYFHEIETGKWREHTFFDKTAVTFNPISHDLLELYLKTGDSLDKAGAYGIQGPSLTFISKVNGSYSNVVGFPLDKIIEELSIVLGANWREKFISA